jgi:hypothetical protein
MNKILSDNHQTEIRLDRTLGTKTLNVGRLLDGANMSISIQFNGFDKGAIDSSYFLF